MSFNARCPSAEEGVEYEAHDGTTFRHTTTAKGVDKKFVCSFTARPIAEIRTLEDVDADDVVEKRFVVQYEWRAEKLYLENKTVTLPPVDKHTNLGQEIIAHVPSLQAQLHISSARDVAAAAAAFRSDEGFYLEHVRYRQTGWRKSGTFGFPGDESPTSDVDEAHMEQLAGHARLRFPATVDESKLVAGVRALLEAVGSAPPAVGGALAGTLLAAPIYRGEQHLACRGYVALAVGPTQAGKTTLVSRLYCLLGAFYGKPWTMETWFSTAATLEQATHFFRDLPLFIDDVYGPDLVCLARYELRPRGRGEKIDPLGLHARPGHHAVIDADKLRATFQQMGDGAATFLLQLTSLPTRVWTHHARQILLLRARYDTTDVDAALAHASRFGALEVSSVERILALRHPPRTLDEYVAEETAKRIDAVLGTHVTTARDLAEYDALPRAARPSTPTEPPDGKDQEPSD